MNLIIIIVILALDQLSKLWAVNKLQEIGSIPIIQNIFHLTYVENRGAAFGIFQNQKLFFIISTSIIVIGILVFMYKNRDMRLLLKIGLNLVVAGAIGNFIDRVRVGFVIDFFDFRVWPVFNIADCAVVVGAIVISYVILKYDSIKPEER